MLRRCVRPVFAGMIAGGLLACGPIETPKPPAAQSFPSSEAVNATTLFLTDSIITTRIQSARVVSYADRDSSWAYQLEVDFFDVNGAHKSHLKADSALVRERDRLMEGFGRVRVTTDDGQTLSSSHLAWNDNKKLITTDSLVRLTRGKDVMMGYGFESDPDLTKIKLRREVKGKLTDPKLFGDSL